MSGKKQRMPVIYNIRRGNISSPTRFFYSNSVKPYVPTTRLDKWVWETLLSGKSEEPKNNCAVTYVPYSSSSSDYASSGASGDLIRAPTTNQQNSMPSKSKGYLPISTLKKLQKVKSTKNKE